MDDEPESLSPRWMVLRQDTHGTGALVAENLGEGEARSLADAYEAKGHHQAYFAAPYTPATRDAVLREARVAG